MKEVASKATTTPVDPRKIEDRIISLNETHNFPLQVAAEVAVVSHPSFLHRKGLDTLHHSKSSQSLYP